MNPPLLDLLARVWRAKLWLMAAVVMGAAAGLALSFRITPMWNSSATLAQARGVDFRSAAPGGLLGSLSEITSLSIGGGDQLEEYATIIGSDAFIQRLLIDDGLLPKLYPESWNAAAKRWQKKPPSSLADHLDGLRASASKALNESAGAPQPAKPSFPGQSDAAPSLEQATKRLRQLLQVEIDRKARFLKVGVDARDPVEARDIVLLVVRRLNEHERQIAYSEASRRIGYLQQKIAQLPDSPIRNSLTRTLEVEITRQMLAQTSPEFALRYVNPPVVAETRARPARGQMTFFGAIMGGLLVVLLIAAARLREAWATAPATIDRAPVHQ